MGDLSASAQLIRYAVVGLASNMLLFGAYLVLTYFGIEPKVAMTLSFAVGVTQGYVMNSRWTFAYGERDRRAAYARYWAAYGIAYIVNFVLMILFVDVLRYPHQIVQGLLVIGLAGMLFVLQKYWVFSKSRSVENLQPPQASRQ